MLILVLIISDMFYAVILDNNDVGVNVVVFFLLVSILYQVFPLKTMQIITLLQDQYQTYPIAKV